MKEYKAQVVAYSPKADTMAARVEEKANQMAAQGYALTALTCTASAKAILVFEREKH